MPGLRVRSVIRVVVTPLALMVGYFVFVVTASSLALPEELQVLLLGTLWVAAAILAAVLGTSHAALLPRLTATRAAVAGAVSPLLVAPLLPFSTGEAAGRSLVGVGAALVLWLWALVVAAAAVSLASGRLGLRVGAGLAVFFWILIVVTAPYLAVLLHPMVDNPTLLSAPLWVLVAATGVSGVAPDLVSRHDAVLLASGAAVAPMLATSYVLAYVVSGHRLHRQSARRSSSGDRSLSRS